MNTKNLSLALAYIKEAEDLIQNYTGKREFLDCCFDSFDEIKTYISDSIALNTETKQLHLANPSRSHLNEEQVKDIIKRIDDGEKYATIAESYGVGCPCIHHIATGLTWSGVNRPNGIVKRGRGRRKNV